MSSYFETKDSELCYPEQYFQELMRKRELTEISVFKAKIEFGTGYFYCLKVNEFGETGNCGKLVCKHYQPNNGKNGRCKHYGYLFEIGEKVTLKLKK